MITSATSNGHPAPRSVPEIESQLADLVRLKAAADAYGIPDFASRAGMESLLRHEAELREELRAAQMLELGGTEEENLSLSGILVGGSIESGRFELKVAEEIYRGSVSEAAKDRMKRITFGAEVKARLRVTTTTHEEGATEPATTYFLDSIEE